MAHRLFKLFVYAVGGFVTGLIAPRAQAEELRASLVEVTPRLSVPFNGLIAWGSQSYYLIGGAAVSLDFLRFVEVEAGVQAVLNACDGGSLITLRAGVSPRLLQPGASGRGLGVRLPLLTSYQSLNASGYGCDYYTQNVVSFINAGTGFDVTYYFSRNSGFNLRVLAFLGTDVHGDQNHDNSDLAGGLTFDLGWRFGLL